MTGLKTEVFNMDIPYRVKQLEELRKKYPHIERYYDVAERLVIITICNDEEFVNKTLKELESILKEEHKVKKG